MSSWLLVSAEVPKPSLLLRPPLEIDANSEPPSPPENHKLRSCASHLFFLHPRGYARMLPKMNPFHSFFDPVRLLSLPISFRSDSLLLGWTQCRPRLLAPWLLPSLILNKDLPSSFLQPIGNAPVLPFLLFPILSLFISSRLSVSDLLSHPLTRSKPRCRILT